MAGNKPPWRPFGNLILGYRREISLGRLSFWLILGLTVYFWLERPPADFPPSLDNALGLVLAYNLGGKAFRAFGYKDKEADNDRQS